MQQVQKLGKLAWMVAAILVIAAPAFAQEAAGGGMASSGMIALAAGLGMGIAAFGTALGQGRATAAAMESIGRNPNSADRIFLPLILGLALMEAVSLYMFVIAILLQGKVV
ncbi:MAG: F-type H+-transporting ATPase subunit c [Candidatus Binatota bacterium]|jgi:F-type H+-transporting ATPase subunit c|nr:F-type H+-transporting ATPase subunit c [Candidatus Binatota bacterium]